MRLSSHSTKAVINRLARVISLVVIGTIHNSANAAPANADEESTLNTKPRTPLVVLRKDYPHNLVVDYVKFALYSDGLIIYQRHDRTLCCVLTVEEKREFMSKLAVDEFCRLKRNYRASNGMDEATIRIDMWHNSARHNVSVYGDLEVADNIGRAPMPFVQVFARLNAYEHHSALPWLPNEIEVVATSIAGKDATIEWPMDFPQVDDKRNITRPNSLTMFVSSEFISLLDAIIVESNATNRPVLIGGKQFVVSYRLPLPAEAEWLSPTNK